MPHEHLTPVRGGEVPVLDRNALSIVFAVVITACAASSESPASSAAQTVSVSINPAQASVAPGAQQTFSAIVTGTANAAVTWSVAEGDAGGTITVAGVYTAPGTAGTYHVVATSQADTTASATAAVTVSGAPTVVVAVSPNAASLVVGATAQFTATVTGSSDTAVTWFGAGELGVRLDHPGGPLHRALGSHHLPRRRDEPGGRHEE